MIQYQPTNLIQNQLPSKIFLNYLEDISLGPMSPAYSQNQTQICFKMYSPLKRTTANNQTRCLVPHELHWGTSNLQLHFSPTLLTEATLGQKRSQATPYSVQYSVLFH